MAGASAKQEENDPGQSTEIASFVIRPSPVAVTDPPKFELESYISNYEGLTRLDRLTTISTSSKFLRNDSLTLAAREAKQGRNVTRYLEICKYARSHLPEPAASGFEPDQEWADMQKRKVKAEGDRLESELKGYKNNLIKESIRMGNEEVGMHYYETGELASAWRYLNRMRDYCTTPKHIAEMCLKLILVAIAQDNWMNVQSSVYKIQALQLRPDDKIKIEPVLGPCLGLALLSGRNYAAAAQHFLSTDPSFLQNEAVAGIQFSRQVLTGNDLAVYGALCALATLDRHQLKEKVLDNGDFRNFLELEPHLRRAIVSFVGSKFTQALSILDAYKTDYLLDIHLQRHVHDIYAQIRRKSIVAYFEPFKKVSIAAMGQAFGVTDEQEMENELVRMIQRGELNAHVDAVDKILVGIKIDQRKTILSRSLDVASDTEKALRLRLMRINMIEAGLELAKGDAEKRKKGWGAR